MDDYLTEEAPLSAIQQYGDDIDDLSLIRTFFNWDSPNLNKLFLQLGVYGITLADAAAIIGMEYSEFIEKFEKYPMAKEYYMTGPAIGRAQATAKLFNNVMKGRSQDIQFYLKAQMPELYGNNVTLKTNGPLSVTNVKVDITTLALQHLPTEYLEELVYANNSNSGADPIRIEAPEREQDGVLVPTDGAVET